MPPAFVVWPPSCTGGNEVYGVLVRGSIMEMARNIREKPKAKHHLLMKKDHNYLWSYLTGNLALVWITLVRGSNED